MKRGEPFPRPNDMPLQLRMDLWRGVDNQLAQGFQRIAVVRQESHAAISSCESEAASVSEYATNGLKRNGTFMPVSVQCAKQAFFQRAPLIAACRHQRGKKTLQNCYEDIHL
ncbi:hypothetical protein HK100_000147 [Physocladia obscura]|uniref:Uncharacterized protein n=1 Tax=Physocladia obscura TaxID=109957 RepID=A0AAD5XC08_9FUNG|nr:hypothetical protein HK100_000147 [Physocladia obscura]